MEGLVSVPVHQLGLADKGHVLREGSQGEFEKGRICGRPKGMAWYQHPMSGWQGEEAGARTLAGVTMAEGSPAGAAAFVEEPGQLQQLHGGSWGNTHTPTRSSTYL